MTPRHILSFAVVVFVVFLGLVGIIDALEPGHTLSAVEASELGIAFAALIAGALGVVIARRLTGNRKQGDTPADEEETLDLEE